jgi:hypothetical protein
MRDDERFTQYCTVIADQYGNLLADANFLQLIQGLKRNFFDFFCQPALADRQACAARIG